MNEIPKVTVGIPLRNGEDYIAYTLENLKSCRYPIDKLEIIIGNHDSTDQSISIIEKYQTQIPVRVIHVPYSGPNRAFNRNKIIDQANGDIIIFIDADILVSEYFIQEHVRLHQLYGPAYVAGYTFGKNPISKKMIKQKVNLTQINSSHDILRNNLDYIDYRVNENNVKPVNGVHLLKSEENPWILFWSCNISITVANIKEIGRFDDSFVGWGLEDDELAYRCCFHQFNMVFAEKAWAFHMPHEINSRKNYLEKQNNLKYFFNKWKNRELELFHFYGDPHVGEKELIRELDFYPDQKTYQSMIEGVSKRLKKNGLKRAAFFISNEKSAEELGLSHCCIPFLNWKTPPYRKGKCTYYSYMGIKTHFDEASIDETILFMDTIIFLGKIHLYSLLLECARISKKVLIICSELHLQPLYQAQLKMFYQTIERIAFQEIEFFSPHRIEEEARIS